jgi:hypothetical protein
MNTSAISSKPSYSKRDPACGSKGQILFVGNVKLEPFDETKEPYLSDPATAVLVIDVMASPGYEDVPFHFVTLELKIVGPSGARFVRHSAVSNYFWEVPHSVSPVIWVEKEIATPWLRIRDFDDSTGLLHLGAPGTGRTYFVGIGGFPAGSALEFTVFASASEARVTNCELTIANLHAGQALDGYLS